MLSAQTASGLSWRLLAFLGLAQSVEWPSKVLLPVLHGTCHGLSMDKEFDTVEVQGTVPLLSQCSVAVCCVLQVPEL